MGVVEGRPEHLAAGQVLERRRDAATKRHRLGVERLGEAEAGQGGAIGAGEEDRLDQVAARLLDRQRGDLAIVERAFAHHPIDGERKLLVDLPRLDLGDAAVAAPLVGEQGVGVGDRPLAAFDRDIHQRAPSMIAVERGSAARRTSATKIRSTPSGNPAWFAAHWATKSVGRGETASVASPLIPGPLSRKRGPASRVEAWATIVVERSGYSAVPDAKRARSRPSAARSTSAKAALSGAAARGAPVWKAR